MTALLVFAGFLAGIFAVVLYDYRRKLAKVGELKPVEPVVAESMSLEEYLATATCKGFKPVLRFLAAGNYLEYYAVDVQHYAEQIDNTLTVYVDESTERVVGVKIHFPPGCGVYKPATSVPIKHPDKEIFF